MIPTRTAYAGAANLAPRKLPFPLNDKFGAYEPTISADGNTIYFARFASNGDTRVKGPTDIFVTHRIRPGGEWPGTVDDWSPAERLPDTVNSDSVDQEPWITPDGKTLYFMSSRKARGVGPVGIWVTHKQADGEWSQAQPVSGGNINSENVAHCFTPFVFRVSRTPCRLYPNDLGKRERRRQMISTQRERLTASGSLPSVMGAGCSSRLRTNADSMW